MSHLVDEVRRNLVDKEIVTGTNEDPASDHVPVVSQSNPIIFQPSELNGNSDGLSNSNNQCPIKRRKIVVICWNIRGLYFDTIRSKEKMNIILNLVKELKTDIILLQEIHFERDDDGWLKSCNPQFVWFTSGGSGRSQGVAVGIRIKALQGSKVEVCSRDKGGRWIIVKAQIWGSSTIIGSIYVPSFIKELTMDSIANSFTGHNADEVIFGGDFNIDSRKEEVTDLLNWGERVNLTLVGNPQLTFGGMSTIDHLFISEDLAKRSLVLDTRVGNGLDHSILTLSISDNEDGKVNFPFPRIDPSACSSPALHNEILLKIGEFQEGNNPLTYLKEFGRVAADLVINNRRIINNDRDQKVLCVLVSLLGTNGPDEVSKDHCEIPEVKELFELYIKYNPPTAKMKRRKWKALVRQSIRDFRFNHGVKISHLFPPKIKLRKHFKSTASIADDDGKLIDDRDAAEKHKGEFWKDIFTNERDYDKRALNYLIKDHKKLNRAGEKIYKVNMELLEEIFQSLCDLSPGWDGIPFALFISSFIMLKRVWVILIEGLANGSITADDEFGNTLVALIPKLEGTIYPKDFRPIAITSVIYRLIMKYFAKELSLTIEPIISSPQRALLKGRTISSAVRHVIDLFYSKLHRKEKVILLKTDFYKAFDYVNRAALLHVLEQFELPIHLRRIAAIALSNNRVRILGQSTSPTEFDAITGVRQGCPISPLLYLIIVDLLVYKLVDVKGVIGLGCYADDNGIVLNRKGALRDVMAVIKLYEKATGVLINVGKCEFLANFQFTIPMVWKGLKNVSFFKYLGVPVGCNITQEIIWSEILAKIKRTSISIKQTQCSFAEKIALVNTRLIPLCQYVRSFYLMDGFIAAKIWASIRNCIGVKGAVSNLGLIKGPLSLNPAIRDPYLANVAALASSPPRTMNVNNISPYSTLHHRNMAILVIKKGLEKYENSDYLINKLTSADLYMELVQKVGRRRLPAIIYNSIAGSSSFTVPVHLLSKIGADNGRAAGLMCRNLELSRNSLIKNSFILLIHKAWPTSSKLLHIGVNKSSSCCFCGSSDSSHLHLIRDCPVISWVYHESSRNSSWPKNVNDLMLCWKNLSRKEVNIRLTIIHCLYTGIALGKNFTDMICSIAEELDKREKDPLPIVKDSKSVSKTP
jgi:hypothetical protein